MKKYCELSVKKLLVFVSVLAMMSVLLSFSVFAANTEKCVKLTGTKVDASSLKKNTEGKLSQAFSGNYLLIKQSTFAIVWTPQELSTEAKNEFSKRIVELDPSLKNGIKEALIFVNTNSFTKAQNAKANNVYKVEGTSGKYTFTVVNGGVSHIVYGVYEYCVKENKPEAKPTCKPEAKPTCKPETKPSDRPEATTKPSDDKTDNEVKPSESPVVKPTGNPDAVVTAKPEDEKVDAADTKVDGVNTGVEDVVKPADNKEELGAAQATTEEEVLAANIGNMDNTPKTGDELPLLAGVAALFASFAVMVTVVYIKKKC